MGGAGIGWSRLLSLKDEELLVIAYGSAVWIEEEQQHVRRCDATLAQDKHLGLTVEGSTFRYGNSIDWKMKYRPATCVFLSVVSFKHVSKPDLVYERDVSVISLLKQIRALTINALTILNQSFPYGPLFFHIC